MWAMSSPAPLEITIAPAFDHRGGHFDARLGREVLVRAETTPFRSSARVLLTKAGCLRHRRLAKPDDMIVMKRAGSQHEVLRATAAKVARR
jgi:hypothetical protein